MTALALVLVALAQAPELVEGDAGAVELDAGVAEAPVDGGVEAEPEAPADWFHGDHLTGEWGGARTWLAAHGLTFDIFYAPEIFVNVSSRPAGVSLTGHLDATATLDVEQLGLWSGGKFVINAQNNHGPGINEFVGSVTEISNIEAKPYTQIGEFFYEQSILGKVRFRLGKQDANREFGTPRFGGNFINNNFGMLPSSPLPSYPTNGLAAVVVVTPVEWLAIKASIFEGAPKLNSLGFDTAFVPNAGHFLIGGVTVLHPFTKGSKNVGNTSIGAYQQAGSFEEFTEDPNPRTFTESYGFFVQNDDRLYLNPMAEDDPRCFTFITRVGWAQPDRALIPLFLNASLVYHGLGYRQDDTVGVGGGYFTVSRQANGASGPGGEYFVEVFYKLRLTKFFSLQPDLQYYRTPGGDGRDAVLAGLRLKFKL